MQNKLTAEQLEANFELHLKIIDKYLSPDRAEKVKAMIQDLAEDYVVAPASGKKWYHGAYPGGYLVHVNNVVRLALKQVQFYKSLGGTIDFTEEELVFSALFHDLGKVGDGTKPNYVPQTSEWHVKNQGSIFVNNPELDFMLIPDRSLFVLQKYGIPVTQKEYLAIKLHDGMFEESNKAYYVSFNPDARLKTNLCHILHVADLLAARLEQDLENKDEHEQ